MRNGRPTVAFGSGLLDARRRPTRREMATMPAPVGYGLPPARDPLWRLGHDVVTLVAEYMSID